MSRAARPPSRFRRSRWLRWPVVGAAILLASCQPAGVLDPQGPIASAERLLLINSTAIMLVVVVPVIVATLAFAWWYRSSNTRASRSPDESYEGRVEFVVWSIPALTVILLGGVIWIGSHQLDPRAPIPGEIRPAARGRRGARLEMAVHLPRSGCRRRQSAGHPGRNSRRISTHLGDGDEFVLRAAARQPDLHDGRHDHAPQPARGQAGRVSRLFGKFQRRRLFRDAVRRQVGARRRFQRLARAGARHRIRPRRCRLRRAGKAEPRPCRPQPIARWNRSCSSASSTRLAGPETRERRDWCPPMRQAGG